MNGVKKPRVAKTAKQTFVFQRTPSSVGARGNYATDPAWFKAQTPGWTNRRRTMFLEAVTGRADDTEIRDGWTDSGRLLRETTADIAPRPRRVPRRRASQ